MTPAYLNDQSGSGTEPFMILSEHILLLCCMQVDVFCDCWDVFSPLCETLIITPHFKIKTPISAQMCANTFASMGTRQVNDKLGLSQTSKDTYIMLGLIVILNRILNQDLSDSYTYCNREQYWHFTVLSDPRYKIMTGHLNEQTRV